MTGPNQSTLAPSNDLENQIPDTIAENAPEDAVPKQHAIQFLDLHTGNPIVSFKGEAYSCTWVDLIGTNMFFSQAKETPLYDPEISTSDYDMVGTSRIKLVGNPIKVTPIAQNTAAVSGAKTVSHNQMLDVPDKPGKSLGTIRRTSAKVNADLRKQASFLEQLMNVKRNRGEKDNVHIVMNSKISKAVTAGKLKFTTQRREEEIDQLNRRIVRGDGEALRKLEQIYSGQDEDSDDDVSAGEEVVESTAQLRDHHVETRNPVDKPDIPDAHTDAISTHNRSLEPTTNSGIFDTSNDEG